MAVKSLYRAVVGQERQWIKKLNLAAKNNREAQVRIEHGAETGKRSLDHQETAGPVQRSSFVRNPSAEFNSKNDLRMLDLTRPTFELAPIRVFSFQNRLAAARHNQFNFCLMNLLIAFLNPMPSTQKCSADKNQENQSLLGEMKHERSNFSAESDSHNVDYTRKSIERKSRYYLQKKKKKPTLSINPDRCQSEFPIAAKATCRVVVWRIDWPVVAFNPKLEF